MRSKRCLLWFTKDLRVHDNPLIDWPIQNQHQVIGVAFAPLRQGVHAKSFFCQSVFDLKNRFERKGLSFLFLSGLPEKEIPILMEQNAIDYVLTQRSFNTRDQRSLEQIEVRLGVDKVHSFRHQTLFDVEQLPFLIQDLPLVFTSFRRLVEEKVPIPAPVEGHFDQLRGFKPMIPENLSQISFLQNVQDQAFDLQPGETGALERLKEYFWESQSIAKYKETRNGLLFKNESSKFSPYLATGSLSPRLVFRELKRFSLEKGESESTKGFFLELLWRDYFKFLALKVGPKLFLLDGVRSYKKEWANDLLAFKKWVHGRTGVDFVDANMTELATTGWMSNRGRQNVASYLAKQLKVNWIWGAQYFEEYLVDYDTESNWGNWQYLAGVGTDPRDRNFNIQRQTEMYDPNLVYCKHWLNQRKSSP